MASTNTNTKITPTAAAAAEATLRTFRTQQRQAADQAAELERLEREQSKARFADTRQHFEAAISNEVRSFVAGDADAPARIALLIPEAIEACEQIEVEYRGGARGRVKARAKACLRSLNGDATACVSLYRAICAGFGVSATGLECIERGEAETFERRAVRHPALHFLLVAWDAPTARNIGNMLRVCAEYLEHFEVREGRQGAFSDLTLQGGENYRRWIETELLSIHRPEADHASRASRYKIRVGETETAGGKRKGRYVWSDSAEGKAHLEARGA